MEQILPKTIAVKMKGSLDQIISVAPQKRNQSAVLISYYYLFAIKLTTLTNKMIDRNHISLQ